MSAILTAMDMHGVAQMLNPTSITLYVALERDRAERDLAHQVAVREARAGTGGPSLVARAEELARSLAARVRPAPTEPACVSCPVPA
jgi:hypothetical protein